VPEHTFVVSPEEGNNQRLDVFLRRRLPCLSRTRIQRQIEEGKVLVGGRPAKSGFRLRGGETVSVSYEEREPNIPTAENIPLDIIHSDEEIVVINKPSGMVVHPGAGTIGPTLVHGLLHHFPGLRSLGPEQRPGIVHRLDKDTSGILVAALTPGSYWELQRQFKARVVKKEYLALVWGRMPSEGEIDFPIGRHVKHGQRISVKTKKPRAALTRYRLEKVFEKFSLVRLRPVTGRTHQLRVHLAALGHPVVGDPRYGGKKRKSLCPRLFLHAERIAFNHPASGENVEYSAPLPSDLSGFLKKLEEKTGA
jgi:23S rRNA pseudouridine1911/1915/1917 synthase